MSRPLTFIGNVNVDLIMGPVAPWPQPGTEVILADQDLRFGGSAGNSALAAIALGGDVRIVANRGRDAMGEWLAGHMRDHAARWALSSQPTAISVGLGHPDGERTFFTALCHLGDFSLEDVVAQLPQQARAGEICLLSGAFVTPRLAADYGRLMTLLRERGFAIALDTGWPSGGWTETVRQQVRSWCGAADIVLFNETEILNVLPAPTLAEAARALRRAMRSGGMVVAKRGRNGASLFAADEEFTVPAPAVPVVDTIGAGDVFNAAFLLSLQNGETPIAATTAAIACASRAVSTRPRQFQRPQAA